MIKYDNIYLRKYEPHKSIDLVELKSESWFGTHNIAWLTYADQTEWIKNLDSDPISPKNIIFSASTFIGEIETPIGIFKLFNTNWVNRTVDVGWDVAKEFRGLGYGKKIVKAGVALCFEAMNLRRLNAEILSTNIASQKCAEFAGFKKEGIKQEAVLRGQETIDSIMYGYLSKKWFRR